MDSRKIVLQETSVIAIGQIICIGAMFGVYALLGMFDSTILWGGIAGGLAATLNFLFMAIGASIAADKAEAQNVNGGKLTIRISYLVRTAVLFIVLYALVKSGLCDVIALVFPLFFVRPILTVGEFFRKPGERKP